MRNTTAWALTATAAIMLGASACNSGDSDDARDTTAGRDTTGRAATAAADPDNSTGGGGIPAGYMGRADGDAALTNASYTRSGDRWEVRTGPRHIVYSAGDTARGNYTAAASVDQVEAAAHREAYGIFIGGRNLDQPSQQYTYFVVGGTGEYLIKVRDGAETRDVVPWTAHAAVPKADASGKASHRFSARVQGDSVVFMVNDQRVAAVAKSRIPTDGIAGLRINHNLHLSATPVSITRG